jgi:uncharacterized membrane protein
MIRRREAERVPETGRQPPEQRGVRRDTITSVITKLTTVGRLFVAIAMIAFGVQHLVYLGFVTRLVPELPRWIPGHPLLACVFGAFLIVAGAAIAAGREARTVALLLGGAIFLSFAALYVPLLLANPLSGGVWTKSGKALALAGGSFLVAGSFLAEAANPATLRARIDNALKGFIPLGRFFLAAFLVLAGILHFVYADFVARLVPSWIPAHLFWTYFTGSALIAGGIGIMLPWTTRLAASLSGLMIFLWIVLLHIPRAVASPHDSNETTAVFEALAMSGAAILVAVNATSKKKAAQGESN